MFGSDNQAPAHPKVLEALLAANQERLGSYGDDPWTKRAVEAIHRTFETDDLDVYFVATGGAANGLALSTLCPAWGAVLTHDQSHLLHDEGSGPEFFTSGARIIGLGLDEDKLTPQALEAAAQRYSKGNVHGQQPHVVSISNLSESGLIYTPAEIEAISAICKAQGWFLHMDGARFGNAVIGSGKSASLLSWRARVDSLSFGLTKTGGMACEAVIMFGKDKFLSLPYQRKRAGQLLSKHRFYAAQFVAMLENDLWLNLASHANAMATQLGDVFAAIGNAPSLSVDGNEIFVRLSNTQSQALKDAGLAHYPWTVSGQDDLYRFVASWQTREEEIAKVGEILTTLTL
jgi:threonine aldolase